MEKVDRSVVNMANKVNVLRILWENKCIFRAEIARMTGLSQPTVLKIVDEFMERGLVPGSEGKIKADLQPAPHASVGVLPTFYSALPFAHQYKALKSHPVSLRVLQREAPNWKIPQCL